MRFKDCRYTQIIHVHVPSFQVASGENNALLGVRVRVGIENKGRTKGGLKAFDGNLWRRKLSGKL